jgi:hypothetical protein
VSGNPTLYLEAQLAGGRMNLVSGAAPVPPGDTSGGTIFYAPYIHDYLSLYDGTRWRPQSISANAGFINVTVPAVANKNYDVFYYFSGGKMLGEAVAWTNDTTRATALATQDGILVKSGDATRRYMGTFRTTSSGQTEDSKAKRFLWNYYNRRPRHLELLEATASWQYSTATWRQARATATNQVEVVIGVDEDPITVEVQAAFENTAANVSASVGLGLDKTNGNDATVTQSNETDGAGYIENLHAKYRGAPGIGYHYVAWVEWSQASPTTTFYGDTGTYQSGMMGEVFA